MKRQFTIISLAALILLGMPTGLAAQDKPPGRAGEAAPNFVFFLVDDLGVMDVGAYGSTFHHTPNVDKLATEGMLFTDAYATAPICTPTRASLLTGKAPGRLRITQFGRGVLPHDDITIAEALKENGYATGFFGKWHLTTSGQDNIENWPQSHGFDVNIGGFWQGGPYWKNPYFSPYLDKEGRPIPNLESGPDGEYLTDRMGMECANFIEENKDGPFFAYLSFYSVHRPHRAPAERIAPFTKKRDSLDYTDAERCDGTQIAGREVRVLQDNPTYAAMVYSMDSAVGVVLDKLQELNLADNTIVIFFSDNGGLSDGCSDTSNFPYRAGKGYLYDGGVREPCIVRWPGVVEAGSKTSGMISSNDFFPTILDMAGLDLLPQQHMDGKSIVPLLKKEYNQIHSTLYWHYPHRSNQGGRPSGAIRVGNYKLVEHFESKSVELFDLAQDEQERNNLANDKPAVRDSLLGIMYAWRDNVDASGGVQTVSGITKLPEPLWLEGCMDVQAKNYDQKFTTPCPGCCEYENNVRLRPSHSLLEINEQRVEIAVSGQGAHAVLMYDPKGNIVFRRRGGDRAIYRPQGLSAGLYLVLVTTSNQQFTGKMLIH